MLTLIQSPTPNLEQSLDFYTRLGFEPKTIDGVNYFSDGRSIIKINTDRFSRIGLVIYGSHLRKAISQLNVIPEMLSNEEHSLLTLPGNLWIYLIDGEGPPLDFSKETVSVLGNGHGISIETAESRHLYNVLNCLGFELQTGQPEDSWFVLVNKQGFSISIMKPNCCPHLFFSPSLNYFNGKENLNVIENIRNKGIGITEEITHFNDKGVVDNIIIRDPGGLGFFIFSD